MPQNRSVTEKWSALSLARGDGVATVTKLEVTLPRQNAPVFASHGFNSHQRSSGLGCRDALLRTVLR